MPAFPLILIVEDDEDDRQFIREAFEDDDLNCELVFAADGSLALDLLITSDRLPTLMLLDINMPRMNGFDLLERVRSSVRLRRLPVIMFSTSNSAETIASAYDRGANSFIPKPSNYLDFTRVLGEVRRYWIQLSRVPDHSRLI